jgi:hypothetical protein
VVKIPDGYKVAVVGPDGTIADTIDIGGADLTRTQAASWLAGSVEGAVRLAEEKPR